MNASAYVYRFGNRTISCPFPMPNLQESSEPSDISLQITAPTVVDHLPERTTWCYQWPDRHGNILIETASEPRTRAREDGGCTHLLRFLNMCEFRLDPARGKVDITHLPTTGPDALEHVLIDYVLPCFLDGLGELVVHAGCVAIGPECALLLGQTGWGKSTLTSLLRQAGHAPLSDDCTLMTLCGTTVHATPTYPSLRLYDDSIGQTFVRIPTLYPVAGYTDKRRIRLEPPAVPLNESSIRAIYLLNDPGQPTRSVSIGRVSPAVACTALIKHSFRLDLRARGRNATLLRQAATVAQRLPFYALGYPRDFSHAAELITILTRHFATLPTVVNTNPCDSPAPQPDELG